jgi:hypothetical protein
MEPQDYLSPHFSLAELTVSETAVRKGLDNTPSGAVIDNLRRVAATLEEVRAAVGNRPVLVTSGFRSHILNKMIGGADQSAHILGLAADFHVPGMSLTDAAQAIITAGVEFDQLILEAKGPNGWLHIGLSTGKPRNQLLTAVFTPGRPTRYLPGLA